MSDPTIEAPVISVNSLYKDWTGSPCHILNAFTGRPLNPWGFSEIYSATGLVVVREDTLEGSVGAPYSLKTHAPGQCVSRFTTNSNYNQALAHGVAYNVVMNGVMNGVAGHSDFILGDRVFYTTWRLRGLTRSLTDGSIFGSVYVGGGVGPGGVSLTQMYVVGNPPTYVLSADFTVGATNGDRAWQLEVGFGSAQNALDTFADLGATPEWPAFTGSVPESNS